MTMARFDFQHACIRATTGVVLNIGCNDDPGHLKVTFGPRLINCDDRDWDVITGRPIIADLYFDCGVQPWPVDRDTIELVILGDILEHLTEEQQRISLAESRRVAQKLCLTVPNDDRFLFEPPPHVPGASFHITQVTAGVLRTLLEESGWHIMQWKTVEYGFVPEGYFVLAERGDVSA